MKISPFLLPGIFSAAVHVGVLTSGVVVQDSAIILDPGESAVTLNIVSSFQKENKPTRNMSPMQTPAILENKDLSRKPVPASKTSSPVRRERGDDKEKGVKLDPVAVGVIKPKYPRVSRILGEEGTVVYSVDVLATGEAGKVYLVESSGFRRLDRSAAKALRKATFIPGKIGRIAIASTKEIAFRFDLRDKRAGYREEK